MKCWCRPRPKTILGVLVAACTCALAAGLVCRQHTHGRQPQLVRAERALRQGDLVEARALLTRCLDSWPEDAQVLCLAARLERIDGRYQAADALLSKCVKLNGPGSLSALEAALLRAQQGDLTDEGLLLKSAAAAGPESPWIFEALARAHLSALRFSPALRRLQQWLQIQPDCVRALEMKARIYEHVDRGDEAMDLYERVLKIQPGRWRSRLQLAEMLLKQRANPKKTAYHVDILQREHVDESAVCRLLAERDLLQGKVEQARTWLERALAADPNSYAALLQRGRLELQMSRPDEAAKHLEHAAQLKPSAVEAHLCLVNCYSLINGKKAESERHRQKAFTLKRHGDRINQILIELLPKKPKDPALHAEVGKHFLAIGEDRRGVEWLRRALAIDPNCQAALASLGEYERQHVRGP